MRKIWTLFLCLFMAFFLTAESCENSDDVQRRQQERILKEGTSQIGMPSIKNFREKKLMKDIFEMRDQNGLVTYTYLENMMPVVVHGHTALGGKLTYFGESIGYGLPYATEFTNPQKIDGGHVMAQADPNGLFPPAAAEGTWVLMKNPNGDEVKPIYVEPKVVVLPWKLPMD